MSEVAKKVVQGPSKLSKILQQLKAKPQLSLTGVKSLKLTYAFWNDHFGARHFAKEDLPRIRWANPNIDIQVERVLKTAEQQWRPELAIQFADGKSTTFNLENKYSKSILRAVMDAAGGKTWEEHKATALLAGQPILPGEELETTFASSGANKAAVASEQAPNWEEFKKLHPEAAESKPRVSKSSTKEPVEPAATPAS